LFQLQLTNTFAVDERTAAHSLTTLECTCLMLITFKAKRSVLQLVPGVLISP